MDIKFREVSVAADMIPMDMGGRSSNRLVRQPAHRFADIADSQSRIDQQRPLLPNEQIAVRLLPVAVLAEDKCAFIHLIDGEPVCHIVPHTILYCDDTAQYSVETSASERS